LCADRAGLHTKQMGGTCLYIARSLIACCTHAKKFFWQVSLKWLVD
jgi:hypothetical protein